MFAVNSVITVDINIRNRFTVTEIIITGFIRVAKRNEFSTSIIFVTEFFYWSFGILNFFLLLH